jgi:hypothetical protein
VNGNLKEYPYGHFRLSKGNMEFPLNAMAFNLKKAVRIVEICERYST